MELLRQALENWGIGGKTSSGYGVGTLDYSNDSGQAVAAQTFTPGQQVEAVYRGQNKKGYHQVEIMLDSKPISTRWEGDAPNASRGATFNAVVKSYDPKPGANPALILGPAPGN